MNNEDSLYSLKTNQERSEQTNTEPEYDLNIKFYTEYDEDSQSKEKGLDGIRSFLEGIYKKPQIVKRFIVCLIAVCMMGVCVSWLALVGWGTDPCSGMNMGISVKLGMTFGNWQALLNTVLFILVLIFGKENIGFGTLLNMFMVGYSCDFMNWLRMKLWPELVLDNFWVKLVVMLVALSVFIVVASIYMTVNLGTAPYDAICFIIWEKQKRFSFKVVRVLFDATVVAITLLVGGRVGVVTILMTVALGPVIQFMGTKVEKLFFGAGD